MVKYTRAASPLATVRFGLGLGLGFVKVRVNRFCRGAWPVCYTVFVSAGRCQVVSPVAAQQKYSAPLSGSLSASHPGGGGGGGWAGGGGGALAGGDFRVSFDLLKKVVEDERSRRTATCTSDCASSRCFRRCLSRLHRSAQQTAAAQRTHSIAPAMPPTSGSVTSTPAT